MIRLLLADDHLLFRSMLEEMLSRDSEIEIVKTCADGESVVVSCGQVKPDIVLMDIGMPGKGGIEALKEIKASCPEVKVVMLTTFEDDENIKKAIRYGADGYLIKDMHPEVLIMSLKCIYQGMVIFHQGVYNLLQTAVCNTFLEVEKRVQIDDMVFDAMDIKIIKLIVQGKSNRDIGHHLNYSEGTIKNKITKLLAVTGLSDRTELSVFAVKHEIV